MKVIEPDLKPPIISEEKNFKIVALSDLHIGGVYGYLPSGCLDKRGKKVMQDEHQEIKEKNLLKELEKIGEIDILMLLGDIIEGKMAKSGGLDVLDVNTDLQIQWAADNALSPMIKLLNPKYVIGCTGSEYHVSCHNDLLITERLNNLFQDIKMFHGYPIAKFIIGEKFWNLSHNGSIGGVSKVGALDRVWKKTYQKHYTIGRAPDVYGFGHIHTAQVPVQLENGPNPVYSFIVPCQKRPDPFCNGRGEVFWDCGFLYMEQTGVELWGKYINTYKSWEMKQ